MSSGVYSAVRRFTHTSRATRATEGSLERRSISRQARPLVLIAILAGVSWLGGYRAGAASERPAISPTPSPTRARRRRLLAVQTHHHLAHLDADAPGCERDAPWARAASNLVAPMDADPVDWAGAVCGAPTEFARSAFPTSASSATVVIPIFVSSNLQLDRVTSSGNLATWDAHLLAPNVVVAVFYPEGLFRTSTGAAFLNATECKHARPVDGCSRIASARGHPMLLCPVSLQGPDAPSAVGAVPWAHGYNGSLQAARSVQLKTFCGLGNSGEYIVSTKWYTYPMLRHALLGRFDFFAKIDLDVCFRSPVDIAEVFLASAERGASLYFLHTKLTEDNVHCDRGLGDMVRAYAAEHACSVNAQTAIWTRPGSTVGATNSQEANPMVPYSNLIGGWLGFWQSRRMLHFAHAWHRWPDGWLYRWTDQQFWLVAMAALNVTETRTAHIPGWRYRKFERASAGLDPPTFGL